MSQSTFSVCLLFGVTLQGDAVSMFIAYYNRSSKFIRSELINTPGRGILLHLPEKSPQLPLVGSIFSGKCRTPLFLPSCLVVNERTNFKQRLYALKKYRLIILNDRHIKNPSFTSSPAHTALKKAVKVVWIAITAIVGLLLWAILKPIFRGVGWLISILTAIGIIYWITTL